MELNDEISVSWYNAASRAESSRPEVSVPALSASDMCARCAGIDFPSILQQHVDDNDGTYILSLEPRDELNASACSLCRVFGSVAPPDLLSDSSLSCQLRAFSAIRFQENDTFVALSGVERLDAIMLGVVHEGRQPGTIVYDLHSGLQETGFLCPIEKDRPPPYFGVRVLTEAVDFDFVKRCITHCQYRHKMYTACSIDDWLAKQQLPFSGRLVEGVRHAPSLPEKSLQYQGSFASGGSLPFRLIDCVQRAVVTAPCGSPYIALSYLWGPSNNASAYELSPPGRWSPSLETLPKTIDDSIEATLLLGLDYLWVDRYCINQSDSEEKQKQVSQMDMIYANAELTIIAAAGSDPDHGLPGVRETKRSPQPALRIGSITLASTLPHPSWSLRNSMWATRGWTYQEGLLSKRRLVFTAQQTYFECNNMHITEAALMPLDVIHLRQSQRRGRNSFANKSNVRKSFPDRGDLSIGAFGANDPGSYRTHIRHFIVEYSTRDLTYSGDTLNAMQGIFMHFGKLQPPFDHLMGIPMVCPDRAGSSPPVECFLKGLSWRLVSPGTRRAGFPSWTWAGWNREVDYWQLNDAVALVFDNLVWVELPDGNLWEMPSAYNSPIASSQPDMPLSSLNLTFIQIEGRTFKFQLRPPEWDQADIFLGRLGLLYCVFKPDRRFTLQDEASSPKALTAIVIGNPDDTDFTNTMIMGFEERGYFAERVGIFDLATIGTVQGRRYAADFHEKEFAQFLKALPKRIIRLG